MNQIHYNVFFMNEQCQLKIKNKLYTHTNNELNFLCNVKDGICT